MSKSELLEMITNYYLKSPDFNGLPIRSITFPITDDLMELIRESKVFILSESEDENIYINRLNSFGSVDEQLATVTSGEDFTIYPSKSHLSTLGVSSDAPFSKMLMLGECQLHILYFNIEILESYYANPQYSFIEYGYRGEIYFNGNNTDDDPIHSEYIRDYGMAYLIDEPHDQDRAIAVLLRDLSKLSLEAQSKWRGFLLPNQNKFRVYKDFVNEVIYGRFGESYWIFEAVLDQIKFINELCRNIGLLSLFRHEYDFNSDKLNGYRILATPSLKNYYNFISIVEKLIIGNLNQKFFTTPIPKITPVVAIDEKGHSKGTISMLKEWMSINFFKFSSAGLDTFNKLVIVTLKKIRLERQSPAHELFTDVINKDLYRKQNDLMTDLYIALESLMIIFLRHPYNNEVILPEKFRNRDLISIF